MSRPSNLVVWIILGRFVKSASFEPWFFNDKVGHGPISGSQMVQAFGTKKYAYKCCCELREILGRGNCRVQQYIPSPHDESLTV